MLDALEGGIEGTMGQQDGRNHVGREEVVVGVKEEEARIGLEASGDFKRSRVEYETFWVEEYSKSRGVSQKGK